MSFYLIDPYKTFQVLDLDKQKISWSHSYEKVAFYQLSFWPESTSAVGHSHNQNLLINNAVDSDLVDVLVDHRTTGAQISNKCQLVEEKHVLNSSKEPSAYIDKKFIHFETRKRFGWRSSIRFLRRHLCFKMIF